MRIGLETLSCDDSTGIGRIVRSLVREFSAQGHEVHVLTAETGQFDECTRVHRTFGFPGSKALSKILFRVDEVRHLRSMNCDVTYSFGVGRKADVVAAQSCHLAGKDILRSHALSSWEGRNWGLYDAVSLDDERALLTGETARRVIACSNLVKNQIVKYYGTDPSLIEVVPNGVTLPTIDRSNEGMTSRKRQWGLSGSEKTLLFVGNEFARKGLRVVLEAIAQVDVRDLRLLVAGNANPAPYRRLADSLGITGKVTFLGTVRNPEELFGAADLFVLPALYEPFGMVVIEAMAAGVPVITSRICGAVEGMIHGHHGIFLDDPSSVETIAGWIHTLLSDQELSRELSDASRRKATAFSWDIVATRTLEILKRASLERRRQ
jgi:UDP-glucose:(heptosyl)LPS alpha-1,3-glucosyltransferase